MSFLSLRDNLQPHLHEFVGWMTLQSIRNMVIICPTCHLSFKTSQGYQSHRRTQHVLSTDPTGKSYKLTDFFKRVKSKPRCSPAPIEMKTISRVRSTSPELEPPSLPDAKSRPSRSMQSSLPKKSKAGGEVDISHFKISHFKISTQKEAAKKEKEAKAPEDTKGS